MKNEVPTVMATATPMDAAPAAPPAAGMVQQNVVEVVAPTDMVAGYQFNVDAGNGVSYLVSVPAGGVSAGQRFSANVISQNASGSAAGGGGHNIPTGRWRDGLCDCCKFGCCHVQCCLSYWCMCIAMGQVLQRMKLDWIAQNVQVGQTSNAFKVWLGITGLFWLLYIIGQSARVSALVSVVIILFELLFLVVLILLRKNVRQKYQIPEENCGSCEDCCCAFWCNCCTVAQIARHTADYEKFPAQCCTETGLRPQDPEVV